MKTTSVTWPVFRGFYRNTIRNGRYNNASESFSRTSYAEAEEIRIKQLSAAIREGEESGRYDNFESQEHLKQLKGKKLTNILLPRKR